MGQKFISIQTGYCPEIGSENQIEVTFASVPILRSATPQYKKISFSCDHYDDYGCASCGADGSKCPLFSAAKEP